MRTLAPIVALTSQAALVRLKLRGESRLAEIWIECLRRSETGESLVDIPVELHVSGLHAMSATYETHSLSRRPSELRVPDDIRIRTLDDRPFDRLDVEITADSASCLEDLQLAALCDWHLGDADARVAAAHSLCVHIQYGQPPFAIRFWFALDELSIVSGGSPLTIDEWARQHAAWWTGWEERWQKSAPEDGLPKDETAHLASTHFDLSYRPPDRSIFELTPTEAPAILLQPIRDWFEARHARDWPRLVRACKNLDLDETAQLTAARATERAKGVRRWDYARCIDAWWIEGLRAFVAVRGIEHISQTESDAAENTESVWEFALRLRGTDWVIHSVNQGWPIHGTAAQSPREHKPWLEGWSGVDGFR